MCWPGQIRATFLRPCSAALVVPASRCRASRQHSDGRQDYRESRRLLNIGGRERLFDASCVDAEFLQKHLSANWRVQADNSHHCRQCKDSRDHALSELARGLAELQSCRLAALLTYRRDDNPRPCPRRRLSVAERYF